MREYKENIVIARICNKKMIEITDDYDVIRVKVKHYRLIGVMWNKFKVVEETEN